MAKKLKKVDADIVIAGAGPGGCTVARELSKKGKKVALLDRGVCSRMFYGSLLAPIRYMEKYGFLYRTVECDWIVQGKGFSGGTLIYAGSAFGPNPEQWSRYGIDLAAHLAEARRDCWVSRVHEDYLGDGSKRLLAAAQELGYPSEAMTSPSQGFTATTLLHSVQHLVELRPSDSVPAQLRPRPVTRSPRCSTTPTAPRLGRHRSYRPVGRKGTACMTRHLPKLSSVL